jgi:hypothetical protein
MSLNRTIRDFVVKGAIIEKKVGSNWVHTKNAPEAGPRYRLAVTCGNADGRIDWGSEGDYNKVLLEIRVVTVGFRMMGLTPVGKEFIQFYTNSSFSQVVGGSKKYKTTFDLPEYKPTHADCLTYLYLKFKSGVPAIPLYWLQWNFGIYGAVRNHYWKTRFTR